MPVRSDVKNIREQVAGQLRGELLCGLYRAGDPLREELLAERFGVSRMPIRQVLQQLVHEGLLVAKRNCGVTVAAPPPDAVRELLIPMRIMIETYALRVCIGTLNEEDFRQWELVLGRLRLACEGGDYAASVERDFDFHRWLLQRAGLQDLLSLWTMVITKTHSFYEHHKIKVEDLPIIYLVHVALMDLFRAGDVETAVEALRQHILNTEFNQRIHRRWRERKVRRRLGAR